jgi:hypothetical protein
MSSYQKVQHSASDSMRTHGQETNRQCTVKEVKEEGGERKVRCVMGIKPDGSEWLSPWMSTQEQRSGQERSQSAIKPGQNGVIQGSFRQGTFSAQGEAKHAPQPKHAPQTNGPSSSVGKKFRSATHGGEDDQQQGGGSQGSGGGGQGGGGGQQQEKEHYWTNYLVKEDEKLEKWQPQSGQPKSTTTGGSGGGQKTSSSSQQQQGQQQQQKKEEKAMAVTMHEKMGHTAKIGDGDDAVRYAAHEKGAKLRAGKDNFIVTEKDKKNYVKAKIDNYVHANDGQNYVNKPWVIKNCPKDPVPNHDEQK